MRQDERHHTLDDIFVGIDLATRQHQVVVLDGQGHRLTSFKVLHSREGLRELVERCSARRVGRGRGTVHFAFEATGHVWEAVWCNKAAKASLANRRRRVGAGRCDSKNALPRSWQLGSDVDETIVSRHLDRRRETARSELLREPV